MQSLCPEHVAWQDEEPLPPSSSAQQISPPEQSTELVHASAVPVQLASVSHVSRVLVAQQTSPDAHVRAPQISLGVLASAVPPLLLLLLPLRPPLLLLLLLPLRPPLLPLLLLLLLVPLLLLPLLLLLLPEELLPSSPLKPPLPASPGTFVDEPPPHANAATSAAPIDPTNKIRKAFILGLQSGRHVWACARRYPKRARSSASEKISTAKMHTPASTSHCLRRRKISASVSAESDPECESIGGSLSGAGGFDRIVQFSSVPLSVC